VTTADPAARSQPRETLDARLAAPALACWAGAFAGTAGSAAAVVAGGTAAALVLAVLALRGRRAEPWRRTLAVVVAAVVCLAGGAVVGALHRSAVLGSGLVPLATDRATAELHGVVTGDPVLHRGGTDGDHRAPDLVTVPVRVSRVEARGRLLRTRAPVVVLARDRSWARLLPGQPVRTSGRLGLAEGGRPVAAVVVVRGPPVLRGRPPAVQRVAGRLRAGLRAAATGLHPDARGLLPGLVVGDTSRVPPGLDADMRTAGLTHLVAVSGANLAIVAGFVLLAARWVGVRGRWLPVAAALATAGFVVLARPQPSVVRAAAMGAVGLVALATGRRRRSLAALAGAVVVLLLLDPWMSRSYGFVLSALATGALVLLAPGWAAAWRGRGLPRPLAEAVAVPLAAQVVCAPVVVLLSGQVSLVAVPANLLVAPAVPAATLLGVLAAAVAPVSPNAASLVAHLAELPVRWVALVAHRSAALPDATLPWPSTAGGALLLATLTVLAVALARLLRHRPGTAAGAAAVLGVALVVPAASPGWPPPGWVLAACDVGQGDALVLSVSAGTAVVVDAGPDPLAVDRCLRRLGVQRVPMVLLSHLHADHVEGLPGVLRGRRVGEVALGRYHEPAGELRRVRRWARAAHVPVTAVDVGERMRLGPLRWAVLWPARVIDEDSVPNNASLVLLVRTRGLVLLLTGDVEPPAQRALLARADLPRVDVLKVAHHGSAYQAPQLLAETRPRLALVSVGVGNDYGHPAPSTVRALRRSGALVGRTDRDGTLVVVGDRQHLRLVTSR
jgi:competence protein ComEC